MIKEIWDKRMMDVIEGKCVCGRPIPLPGEIINGKSMICECGIDNSCVGYYDD